MLEPVTQPPPPPAAPAAPTAGLVPRAEVHASIERAVENLRRLQAEDGHWPGDYGGPMFLLPMLVALYHATGTLDRVPEARRARMVAYYWSVIHADGSIGLHAEDRRGLVFTTVLGYVALRILGVPPHEPRLVKMRAWLKAHGGPLGAAPWGKWTLCLLGLYAWEGVHPVLPELWLLPEALPFHPSRMWCHARQVYLPVAWLYGKRAVIRQDRLMRALREELYEGRWDAIDWAKARDALSSADSYRPSSSLMKVVNRALDRIEPFVKPVRKRALRAVFEHIAFEDDVTDGLDIGPVNKVLNAFVHYFDSLESVTGAPRLERSLARTDDYLWDAPDGTKMQGYNGSQLWDVAFATQALLATPPATRARAEDVLARAYGYLRDNQILDDVPEKERFYRHASRGGWPFSTRAHGWPITDCTSEGLKCALALAGRYPNAIPTPLLEDSVRLLLSWQNDDGGWATYEKQRAGAWMERLNPSEVFGDIMVDYSYVECTSACVQALVAARALPLGNRLAEKVARAVERGTAFLRAAQLTDGSFEGSWAVCFSYGTWFGVSGLLAGGVARSDPAIARACAFLLRKQRADGGWGEDGDSCRERRWVEAKSGHVVQTSWALLTLLRAGHRPVARAGQGDGAHPLDRAARFLVERQDGSGGWPKEPLVGVFNRTCLIDYDNYRHYFPLWALSEYVVPGT